MKFFICKIEHPDVGGDYRLSTLDVELPWTEQTTRSIWLTPFNCSKLPPAIVTLEQIPGITRRMVKILPEIALSFWDATEKQVGNWNNYLANRRATL